jgi:hypothetical protein
MAFLDNSGDIILDAVLTDTGRMRLAKGDGSFRVAKFALGDDEIDYSLYNYNNPSGTAYYDLEILQTPVLEAFSNNASSMKSKLISIASNVHLYLPVIKLDTINAKVSLATDIVKNGYILAVDQDTADYFFGKNGGPAAATSSVTADVRTGTLQGMSIAIGDFIQLEQGLDTTETGLNTLDPDLYESQYLVEIDNRFASLIDKASGTPATPSYIDDDNIATYFFSSGVDANFVADVGEPPSVNNNHVIAGPRGTKLFFKLKSQSEVTTSDYIFNQLGTDLSDLLSGTDTIRGILTNIRVTGVTTGVSIDIPLMVVKKIS